MEQADTMLQERLESMARMMEESRAYSAPEVFAWRQLARHVDQQRFDRTGQILAREFALDRLAQPRGAEPETWDAQDVVQALEHLVAKGHVAVLEQTGRPPSYRLILRQTGAADS